MIFIYTLTDPITNEIRYCGKTNNLNVRFIGHLKEKHYNIDKKDWILSLKNKQLKPIIEIIDEVDDYDWEIWERYWISQLKTWGFNLLNKTEGGDSSKQTKHSISTKIKISKAQLGRKLTTEWKKNISLGKKGVKFSTDHIQNLSISHKGKKYNTNMKSIYQIDMNTGSILNKFKSIIEALKFLNKNIRSGSITKVCKGKLKTTYGYYWCYEDEYVNYKYNIFKLSTQKNINQYDLKGNLINKYTSIYEASIKTNLNRSGISHVANDVKSYSYGGYIWLFEGDENKLQEKINHCKNYIVQQIKDNQIVATFSSIKDATNKTNILHISCAISGKRQYAGGFKWNKVFI